MAEIINNRKGNEMYLIQRLTGVISYAFFAVLMYLMIPKVKGFRIHINFYILILALMGFLYIPLAGSDLFRIQDALELYTNMSIKEIWNEMFSSSTPMAVLYYHIVGKLGDNRLLPFINSIITYGCSFGIIIGLYYKRDCRISDKHFFSLAIFFFMSRGLFMATIANIRSMLSLSIIALCVYKIIIEEKKFIKYIFLCILASLMHAVGLVAMILLIIFYIIRINNKQKIIVKGLEVIGLLIFGLYYGKLYINSAYDMGLAYIDASRSSTGYFYIWEFILSIIVLSITIIIALTYKLNIKKTVDRNFFMDNKISTQFVDFILFLLMIDIGLFFVEFNIAYRLSWLITILDMPLIIILFKSNICLGVRKKGFYNFILIISFLMLFIACARGDLCSLKFS